MEEAVLELIRDIDGKRAEYKCGCGNTKVIIKSNVASGGTKSCGCLRRKRSSARFTKHGHKAGGKRTKAYVAWVNMKSRCYNPNRKDYADWGGRGITVCDRWKDSFDNFLADMGEPLPGKTLGRKDNDGPYSPDNCEWQERGSQNLNKRNNVRYSALGKTMTLAEWSRETGIGRVTLFKRLQAGVPLETALTAKGFLGYRRDQRKATPPD